MTDFKGKIRAKPACSGDSQTGNQPRM